MARHPESAAEVSLPIGSATANGVAAAIFIGGAAFLLFAANDNMPGGPEDDDDLLENMRRLYDSFFKHT